MGWGRGLAFLKLCFALKFFCRFYNVISLLGFKHARGSDTSSCRFPPMCFSYIYRRFIYLYSIHKNVHSVIKYSLKELTTSSFSLVP